MGFVWGGLSTPAATSDLHEIFADELVRDLGVPRQEVLEVAENYPGIAEAVKQLYRALSDLRQIPERIQSAGGATGRIASPLAWLRDWLDARRGYFPDLDAAAEALVGELSAEPEMVRERVVQRLSERYGISVRIVPQDVLPDALSHYDFHRRRLMLTEVLPSASRTFELALRLVNEEFSQAITASVTAAEPPDIESRALAQKSLANYTAAALLMP